MTSAADRLRARGGQFRAAGQTTDPDGPRADDDPTPRSSDAPAPRTKRIRRSVDLPPARHYALEEWCTEASRELGFKVTGMAVMNALVAELLRDELLAERVRRHSELPPEPRARRK